MLADNMFYKNKVYYLLILYHKTFYEFYKSNN